MAVSKIYDFHYGSSRAKSVNPLLFNSHPEPQNLICFQQSSASLEKLAKIAIIDIKSRKLNPNNCNVYFLSGYVDLSERILDPYYYIEKETPFTAIYRKHEEIVFREDVDTAISRMCNIISQVSETITTFGAKPIFSTIPPASLRVWNNLRLAQNKTKSLLFSDKYDEMNNNMIQALQKINKFILNKNIQNFVSTPFTASCVIVNRPGFDKNGLRHPPSVHYDRLKDGVHPTDKLANAWSKAIIKAMKQNRGLLSYKTPSPNTTANSNLDESMEIQRENEESLWECINSRREEKAREEAVQSILFNRPTKFT